jgi:hypothetical protein
VVEPPPDRSTDGQIGAFDLDGTPDLRRGQPVQREKDGSYVAR